jgi:hypothetical protein
LTDVLGDALGLERPARAGGGATAPAPAGDLLGGLLGEVLGQQPAPTPAPIRRDAPLSAPAEREPEELTAEELGGELLRQGLEGLLGGQRN